MLQKLPSGMYFCKSFQDICKRWWFLPTGLAILLLFMFNGDVKREDVSLKTGSRWPNNLPPPLKPIRTFNLSKLRRRKEVLLEAKKSWPTNLPPSYGSQLRSYNLSKLTGEEKQFMESYLPVMLSRVAGVGDYCVRHPELIGNRKNRNLGWIGRPVYKPNIFWCPNSKVGYGTWLTNFLREGHFNEDNPKILALPPSKRDKERFMSYNGANFNALSKVFEVPSTDEKKSEFFVDAIRFFVVRHPFTRILSAFRVKFDANTHSIYQMEEYNPIRQEILQKYRPNYVFDKDVFPTFPEFIDYLIDVTKEYKTLEDWRQGKVIWEPFWSHCDVCSSDYTIVSKLETMSQDIRFIAIFADLEEVKNRKTVEWKHKINNKTSFEEAEKYYRLLTMKQMSDLYNSYKDDFEMFHYSIEEYLPLALDYKSRI